MVLGRTGIIKYRNPMMMKPRRPKGLGSRPLRPYRRASGKRPKKESLLLPRLLKKIAPKIGAKVLVEPRWGIVGQITLKNGRRSYFRYNTIDLNPVGAADVAKDKDFAAFFMRSMGYPTVPGKAFFSDEWAETIESKQNRIAAARYARRIGFPLFVKPNSGSQGTDVFKVTNQRELRTALTKIFRSDRVALVQKPIRGNDCRIVVLDDEVISAYERVPLNVIGDGRSTVAQLLNKKQRAFNTSSRDTRIRLDDPRIRSKLKWQGRTLTSIPANREQIFLLDNANLSSGGDAIDVTAQLHPKFKKLAVRLTRHMGLRLCGVDIMVDGSISSPPKKYTILEINAAPGLDHYVETGRVQLEIVEDMYLRILKAIAQ